MLYAFTARDSSGLAASGTLDADSVETVQQQLRSEGKYPTSIRPAGDEPAPETDQTMRASRADVIIFATQLSIMLETGVSLSEALECIARQTEKPSVKNLIDDVVRQVQEGKDFSFALSRHPRCFPRIFLALMKASEKTGLLSKLLTRATAYLRDEQEVIRKVRGALTYPAIMLGFAVTTTVFLLAFVLPKFTMIYASKKAALPLPTKLLMNISEFATGHWMGIVLWLIVVGVGGSYYFFFTKQGSRLWDYLQLRVPLLGPMYRKLHLSRGMRMVGTLSGAGIGLIECVATARELCSNSYFGDLWDAVSNQIQAGKQLSEPLFESKLVPRSVAQMLHSGERSGKLAFVLEQVSGYAEAELKEQIADLSRYIEPIMIVIMGIIIGSVALALLLPILTISKVMAS